METTIVLEGFRLSVQQRRLWSLPEGEKGFAYLSRGSVRIEGGVDAGLLRRAVEAVVARHESLRTTFPCLPGMAAPLQVVAEPGVDWRSGAPGPDGEEPAFDLVRGPLLRASLKESPGGFLLHLTCPALCADRESLALLTSEIAALYGAALGEGEPPGEVMQYADISEWQNEALESADTEAAREPWRKLDLSATVGLRLHDELETAGPFAPASAPVESLPGAELDRLGRDLGAAGEDVLLAAWWALLSRLTGRSDLALGVVADGRGYEELTGVVGPLAKVLPVTCRVEGSRRFSGLVHDVRTAADAALQGQEFFAWDQLATAPGGEAPVLPFSFERSEMPAPRQAGGALFSLATCDSLGDRFQVKLRCWRRGGVLDAALDHDRGSLSAAAAARLAGALLEMLAAVVARPDLAVDDLPTLAGVDRQRLLTGLNDTRSALPTGCLHRLFEAQAGRTPDRVAVVTEEGRLTYAELDTRASRLAGLLRGLGVRPEVLVAIHLDRSLEMVVGILGVLKAGGAYLPLDPGYPRDRRALMLADARPAALLTHSRWADDLPEAGLPTVLLDRDEPQGPADALAGGEETDDPRHPAYVIYTSGSTGRPKGVVVSHGAIANRLLWMQRDFPFSADDRVLQKTPFSFDASIWEIFLPLFTGAELVMVRPGAHRDSAHLVAEVVAHGITVLQLVPSQLGVFLEEEGVERCRSLRRVFCGGEALSLELQRRFFSRLDADLQILYGPTETSIDITFWPCRRGDEQPLVRIGRPIANTRILLLDAALRLLPEGREGELFAAGAGLARGYLGRPDLTAERFLPDPFGELGERMYRTGDLARWLPDGSLAFLGRVDHQVKVRGFRVELGEIEAALVELPEVRAAVVLLAGGALASRLAAFVVPTQDQRVSVDAAREHLRSKLPEHMVPVTVTVLERLPLTPNGKLDRAALAGLEEAAKEVAGALPRTPVEEMLTGVFAHLLGRERVGADEDFFELGGHSLLATQVVSRVRQVFRVDLPLRSVFQAPTAAALAEWIAANLAQEGPQAPAIRPVSRHEALPLSFAQQRLWVLHQMAPDNPFYNLGGALRLRGELGVGALARSLSEIVARHEVLRTAFPALEGRPAQVIAEPAPLSLPVVDLGGLPEEVREEEARRRMQAEMMRPFDLSRGGLLRCWLVRLGCDENLLFVGLHHIVCDGWSVGVLFRELSALYQAFAAGRPSPLPTNPVQYADFAHWQRQWLDGEVYESLAAYWRGQLAEAPRVLELPADRPRPAEQSFRGGEQRLRLDGELSARLTSFCRAEGATLFMTLLASFQALLYRYCGQELLVVGTPIANRNRLEIEPLIGFFVNLLALRGDLSGAPGLRRLVERVRETTLDAYLHQDMPFERLVEELDPDRNLSRTPLFQAVFQLRDPATSLEFGELRLAAEELDTGRTPFELVLQARQDTEGLECWLLYARDVFDAPTAARLLGHWGVLLKTALAEPELPVGELPLLEAAERHQLVRDWNDTARRRDSSLDSLLHELFEAQAERTPGTGAVELEGEELTYGELERRANRLARELLALGAGPEVRVGICLERSLEMVVAMLGVLKAGSAYVPLEPEHPRERLALLLADAGVAVVLSRERWRERLPWAGPLLCLEPGWGAEAGDWQRPIADPGDEALAYVIYTSGSTGRPKGVGVPHRAIVNRLLWMQETYPLDAGDRVLQKTSFSFDASIWEIFSPLAAGARLVLSPPGAQRDTGYLVRSVAENGITVLQLVPSMLRAILEEPGLEEGWAPLRRLFCGGEALPSELQQRFFARCAAELCNLYGPTETAIDATAMSCRRGESPAGVRLGRSIANVSVHVLDGEAGLQPIGVPGELCIGGVGVSRGYLGRPELTAERFVPDSYGGPGARLYRTGDLARRLPTGELEYLGRVDDQVKLRGFRIEPREIEAVLTSHPRLREAVVVAREEGPGDVRLVAYLVPGTGSGAPEERLHRLPNDLAVAFLNASETDLLYREIFGTDGYLRHGVTLADGDCVFDVGANIGLFTLFVHQQCRARVFAFEPLPPIFEKLRANVGRFGLDVKLFECGLSDEPRSARFTYYPHWTAMSGAHADLDEEQRLTRDILIHHHGAAPEGFDELLADRFAAETFTCSVRALSDVVLEQGIERIDLLKIDVEKSELEVLSGIHEADWPKIGQVLVEVHDLNGRLARITGLLKEHGFSCAVERVLDAPDLYTIYAVHPAHAARRDRAQSSGRVLVPTSDTSLEAGELRSWLAERLPEHMVPAAFVFLETLPRLASGKVDRRSLPEPGSAVVEAESAFTAPRTPVEQIVAGIWGEVLGVERVGLRDNFFALGGHSLLATQVGSRLRKAFQIKGPLLRMLFEKPTVAELAEWVAANLGQEGPQAPPIRPVDRQEALPLSFSQQRLWFIEQLKRGRSLLNIPAAVRLSGDLDVVALHRTLAEIVRRHEALRTSFPVEKGQPRQLIAPFQAPALPVLDLAALAAGGREDEARRVILAETRRPFDLAAGPLLRLALLRTGEREHLLILVLHHIVSDGWSVGVMLRELARLYRDFASGLPPSLPDLPVQYADFAHWQRGWLQGEVLAAHLEWWSAHLSGGRIVPSELPMDRPRPEAPSHLGATGTLELPRELSQQVAALSRREGTTVFMSLLAAFQAWVWCYGGATDSVVGTDVANRNRIETEGIIGFFVNQLVLRTDLAGDPTWRELLARVREVALRSFAHQDMPFDQLVDSLKIERTLQRPPLFQLKFIFQNAPTSTAELPGLVLTPLDVDGGTALLDFTLALWETEDGLRGWYNYSTDLFEAATLRRMLADFERVITHLTEQPDAHLGELKAHLSETRKREQRMDVSKLAQSNFQKFKSIKPKMVSLPQEEALIRTSFLAEGATLPLVIEPTVEGVDLTEWADLNRGFLEEKLHRHGALLFRGFAIDSVAKFESLALKICGDIYDENGEHVMVSANVAVPVFYPPDKQLLWHNENSFNHLWPGKIIFCCAEPAHRGGETPIVDSRQVFARIPEEIRDVFVAKGVMYQRNYGDGLGLDWQAVFKTSDPAEVEELCRQNRMEFHWKPGGRLRTRCIRPAVIRHPASGDISWFNQGQHWHISCLDPETRRSLVGLFDDQDLPRNLYFGDGSPIPDEFMAAILDVYRELEVSSPWQKGDVMVVDNILAAHGRNPFEGPRKILVAMGEMKTYDDVV